MSLTSVRVSWQGLLDHPDCADTIVVKPIEMYKDTKCDSREFMQLIFKYCQSFIVVLVFLDSIGCLCTIAIFDDALDVKIVV